MQNVEDKFAGWMQRVDNYLIEKVGVAAIDMPIDLDYWWMFDCGHSPMSAANMAIVAAR